MSNQIQSPNKTKIYNLRERTGRFGEQIIMLARTLEENSINKPLINQSVRS